MAPHGSRVAERVRWNALQKHQVFRSLPDAVSEQSQCDGGAATKNCWLTQEALERSILASAAVSTVLRTELDRTRITQSGWHGLPKVKIKQDIGRETMQSSERSATKR